MFVTFFCLTSTGVLIWVDDAADSSFSFWERFLLASARAVLSNAGAPSTFVGFGAITPVAGFGAFSPDAICGAAPAEVGFCKDGLLLFGWHAAYGCEVDLGCACTGTGTTTFEPVPSGDVDGILLGGDTYDGTVCFCCCRWGTLAWCRDCDDVDDDDIPLACLAERCFEELDELVVRLELDCDVDNWSWTNIMWSPSLMARVSGDLPARKSFTWKGKTTTLATFEHGPMDSLQG